MDCMEHRHNHNLIEEVKRNFGFYSRSMLFFEWEDGPMCAKSRAIILGLLCRLHKLEEEKARLEKSNKIYVVLILVLFVILYTWIWQ
ncbi:hypothetical protein CDL12_18409 [Handroanthus impetiginosus]|uniref:Uncharacterized protein n=1 Tax=Handroanthus impetiginosus TaxID=429701 RepID=A0A2G9GUS4_9LAMI|nr:hypothetical protein CDL12_18409 [Handroanthus impetiginosus]